MREVTVKDRHDNLIFKASTSRDGELIEALGFTAQAPTAPNVRVEAST